MFFHGGCMLPCYYMFYHIYDIYNSVLFGLIERRIYYSVNNPPLLSDSYVDLPLVYGEIITQVTGLTPATRYYFASYAKNNYGSCLNPFPSSVNTLF